MIWVVLFLYCYSVVPSLFYTFHYLLISFLEPRLVKLAQFCLTLKHPCSGMGESFHGDTPLMSPQGLTCAKIGESQMVHFLLVSLQSNPEKDTHLKHRHAHTHTNTSLTKHPPTKPPLFWPAVPLALAHGTSGRQRHSDCVIFQLPCWFGARWFRDWTSMYHRLATGSHPNPDLQSKPRGLPECWP